MHPSRFPLTFLFLHTEGFCALLYLLVCGGGGTGDNLDQLAGNDGLSGSVEENLVLVDHLTGVLGGVVHSVATGRLLAGVALSQTPEDGVGESVLAQVGEELLIGLEGGDVLCETKSAMKSRVCCPSPVSFLYARDAMMASSE